MVHHLCQRGQLMQEQAPEYPKPMRDLSFQIDQNAGRKRQSDAEFFLQLAQLKDQK